MNPEPQAQVSQEAREAAESVKWADVVIDDEHALVQAFASFEAQIRADERRKTFEQARRLIQETEDYGFTCIAGSLEMCQDWIDLKKVLGYGDVLPLDH